ncbi:hypothetical protein Bbelb_056100 [Branchiostoma belcheri]|nr:hypothetical protein Bbelb_056100 [Branchiostoma belcheri]
MSAAYSQTPFVIVQQDNMPSRYYVRSTAYVRLVPASTVSKITIPRLNSCAERAKVSTYTLSWRIPLKVYNGIRQRERRGRQENWTNVGGAQLTKWNPRWRLSLSVCWHQESPGAHGMMNAVSGVVGETLQSLSFSVHGSGIGLPFDGRPITSNRQPLPVLVANMPPSAFSSLRVSDQKALSDPTNCASVGEIGCLSSTQYHSSLKFRQPFSFQTDIVS